MKRFVCWCVALSFLQAPAYANSQEHPFSVKDDIAMVRFSDPSAEEDDPDSTMDRRSPDGKRIAVVTTRGLLDSDQIESTISVFDVSEVEGAIHDPTRALPKPRVIAAIASFPHREQTVAFAPVIKDLRWSPDAGQIYFRGESPAGAYQLYEASLDGKGFRPLTPPSVSVDRFDIVKGTIVYTASKPEGAYNPREGFINEDARDVTGFRITDIVFPGQLPSYEPETFTLSVLHTDQQGRGTEQVPGYSVDDISMLGNLFPFRISPNGRGLIAVTPVAEVPESWEKYDPPAMFEHRRLRQSDRGLTAATNVLRPRQYSLIDLVTGASRPLIPAPNARSLAYYRISDLAVWAADEKRVLVTNVFLPLDERPGASSSRHTEPCAVASVDISSLVSRCLFLEAREQSPDTPRIYDVSFGENDDEVVVYAKSNSEGNVITKYKLQGGTWRVAMVDGRDKADRKADKAPRSERDGIQALSVFVKQGLNDPPTLWASDRATGKARQLWDPNPQFARMSFGEASVFHWRDKVGREWTGGLVKPVGYVPGKRYPLIIQMYMFRENQFLTDGTDPTAFAARHLASAGFVVLQIQKKPSTLSEADPETHLEAYRSAIENLSGAGLIDPGKVGLVGFSWTCWYVVNALIKAPQLFAAATIADGLDNSYMQYMIFGPGPPVTHEQMDTIRGTSPFARGIERWVAEAPGFHLDRVQAPVRIETSNPASVLQEWELYGSLYMQHKPVDLIYFPRGTHIHQKPLERLESQQGNVDWFRFWLENYEDPDPAKRAQYERWRRLKSVSQTGGGIASNR